MIRKIYSIFSKIIFIVYFCVLMSQAHELHDKCELRNGEEGICIGFHECPSAKTLLGKGIFPILCSHDYVCCQLSTGAPLTEGPEVNIEQNSYRRDSKMLETITCLAPRFGIKQAEDETAEEFIYTTNEERSSGDTNSKNINFVIKVGIRKINGDEFFYCGGVLLTTSFVLAPAHCMLYKGQAPEIVQIGNSNNNDMEKIPITKIHTHPDYNSGSMYNDIALLELVVASSYVPACAWRWNEENFNVNTTIVALGHDLQNVGQLQAMTAEVKPNAHCNNLYMHISKLPFGMEDAQLCIANANITEAAACKGFIGSPLLALNAAQNGYYLIGLATYVQQCYSMTYPMIYIKLSAYKEWLDKIIY